MKSSLERKQRKIGLLVLAMSIGAGIAGGVLARSEAALPAFVILGGLVLIFALAIFATIPWWRSLDHMQRDAQYFGWYWGGTAGAAAALVGIIAFSGTQSLLMKGALLAVIGQVAGFALFWIVWRLRHGGGEA
jgi:hypothetical protein